MIAVDLGSNTLRVIKYDCSSGKFGISFEKSVKTAEGLVESGEISDGALQRVVDAIKEAQKIIEFSATETLRAVTTEALRRASNRESVLEKIEEQTGLPFEIISPQEEALLTLKAVKYRLNQLERGQKSSFVLVDIGGGSTELTLSYLDTTVTQSFPIGIVTIAEEYQTLKSIREVLPKLMNGMKTFLNESYADHGVANCFVATAGTPTTIAAMKLGQRYSSYDPDLINGTELTTKDLDRELVHLLSMPYEQREVLVGVGRSALIAAGILIFRELFALVNIEKCIVIDDGLREGVALAGCQEQDHGQ